MMENIIATKIVVIAYVLIATIIGSYFGICTLRLRKQVKHLREHRNRLIESKPNELWVGIVLSDDEKKLILTALNAPEFRNEVLDPHIGQALIKIYSDLKTKIKESIKD